MSSTQQSQASFTPVPATVNPFLGLDPDYVEQLVELRALGAEKRDPFSADE